MLLEFLSLPLTLGFIALRGNDRIAPTTLDDDVDKDHAGVRCPSCKWRPTRHDMWSCNPGCGEVWNTFLTRGECPGCQRFWAETQCTRCGVWSDHNAWYEDQQRR